MKKRIYLSPPHLTGNELNYLQESLNTNWPSVVGPLLNDFLSVLSNYIKIRNITLTNSGTSAIHLSLKALGISHNDIVLTSTFSFVASVNPIKYVGATPVLIESEPDTWNMSPHFLEEAIRSYLAKGQKPKAILLVHLYGMPAKLDAILKIAQKYSIPVIEDAAESLGSRYKNQQLGTFGKLGIISFNGNKLITTGAGGAILSAHKELIDKARFLASQAKNDKPFYEHSEMGYNYQMTTLNAALGLAQIDKIDNYVKLRRRNFDFYKNALEPLGFEFLYELNSDYFSNRWLTTCLLPKKVRLSQIINALEVNNIEARYLWKPMHLQPLYQDLNYFGDNFSSNLFKRGLCLPSGSSLSEDNLNSIVKVIKQSLCVE